MRRSITDEQAQKLGEVLQTVGPCNAQLGYYGDGWIYLTTQLTKNGRMKYHYIEPNGDVHHESPFAPANESIFTAK